MTRDDVARARANYALGVLETRERLRVAESEVTRLKSVIDSTAGAVQACDAILAQFDSEPKQEPKESA